MISSSDLTTYSLIFGPLCVIILVVTVGFCSKKGKSQEEKDQKSGKSKDTQHSIYIMTVDLSFGTFNSFLAVVGSN